MPGDALLIELPAEFGGETLMADLVGTFELTEAGLAVPEPSSIVIITFGLIMLFLIRTRRFRLV